MTLLAALGYAPWAFGSTRDWTVEILVGILSAAIGFWLAGRTLQRRLLETFSARVPRLLTALVLLLLALGWSVTLNPRAYHDPYLEEFAPIDRVIGGWPGTVDAGTSGANMLRMSALLLTILMVTDLFRRQEWRRRLLTTVAIVGVSIALFGLAQKIFQSPLLFWEPERFSTTNFAMYRYHGNAGAFLNLVWPIAAAFAIEAFRRKDAFLARAIWLPATLLLVAAVFVNTSRGGHLIALLLVLSAIGPLLRRARSLRRAPAAGWIAGGLMVAAFVALLGIIGTETAIDRWNVTVRAGFSREGRAEAAQVCIDMFRHSPWFGYGPGTFPIVFPDFLGPYPKLRDGFWRYAHCDYLQTLVEWGAVGAAGFAVVWVGGGVAVVRRVSGVRRQGAGRGGKEGRTGGRPAGSLDAAVLLSLCGIAVHAAFDFPLQIASLQLYAAVLLGVAWRKGG